MQQTGIIYLVISAFVLQAKAESQEMQSGAASDWAVRQGNI